MVAKAVGFPAGVIIPATSVAAMLPIGINGYGLREGAYIALFAPLGISGSLALTASILFALLVSFSSLWGGWIWIMEGRRDVEKKEFHTIIERQAADYFSKGYNCCQSILLAANDIWQSKLDQGIIASGRFFQHGMGCGSTYGALIGAQMVLGILDNRYETKLSIQSARMLSEKFNQTFGTAQCSELRKKQSIMDKIGHKGCKQITFMTAGVFYEFWESAYGNQSPSVGDYSDVK